MSGIQTTDSLDQAKKYRESIENPYGLYRTSLTEKTDKYTPGLVSVIIPCYNNEAFVAAAIESALGQTYSNIEVIVVDDGSTDGSLDVIKSFDDRIRWKTKENAGATAARNDGLELANGEFIQFLDADDAIVEDSVQKRMDAMRPEDDCVFGEMQDIDTDGNLLEEKLVYPNWPVKDMCAYIAENNICTHLPLYRRKTVYEIGGFDELLPSSQEPNFNVRLAIQGHRFNHIPCVTGLRRIHFSTSRIRCSNWMDKEPLRQLKILRCFVFLYNQYPGITEYAYKTVADKLWACGITLGSRHKWKLAKKYFEEALRICPNYKSENKIERIMPSCLGWKFAAYIRCLYVRCRLFLK